MSSPESARRTVERFPTEAINRGDVAAMDELVAEEDLKGGVASVKDAFPDHTVIPEKLLAADDGHVVAREKYVSRSAGRPRWAIRCRRHDVTRPISSDEAVSSWTAGARFALAPSSP